ncbi:TPA: GNAT family N-acetyltransferase [Vibrio vulnificus]|nr:GNAT family N-acetyltransferase [Vibrio vulnificus]HDY7553842.1 GNAT family N-acetyltransferase [Vibrio vulnificus]
MNIETQHLKIRHLIEKDAEDVYEYMCDNKVTFYLPDGTLTKSDTLKFVSDNTKAYAICHKDSDKVIGHIEFYAWFGEHTYEIGWVINPRFQKNGFAFEAASRVLEHAFQTLGVHRVIATAQPENAASCCLMEKLGMVQEGYFRQCIPKGNDVWWDECFYSMLLGDFNGKKKSVP